MLGHKQFKDAAFKGSKLCLSIRLEQVGRVNDRVYPCSESRYMREGIYPNYITFALQKVECSHETHDHHVAIVSKNSSHQLESRFNSYP